MEHAPSPRPWSPPCRVAALSVDRGISVIISCWQLQRGHQGEDTGLLQQAALCLMGLRISILPGEGCGHDMGSAAAIWKTMGFILTAARIYPAFQAWCMCAWGGSGTGDRIYDFQGHSCYIKNELGVVLARKKQQDQERSARQD